MDVTPHTAAPKVAEQRQSEGVAHRVDVEVWNKLSQRLPPKENGADALSQQSEVREQVGLHEHAMPQKHKVNRARKHNVETPPCAFQDLLASHTQVSGVHHKVDVCVPVEKWVATYFQTLITSLFFFVGNYIEVPVLQSPDGTPEDSLSSTTSVTIRVEESHRGAAIPGPSSISSALKPETNCKHQQHQYGDQDHAQNHKG